MAFLTAEEVRGHRKGSPRRQPVETPQECPHQCQSSVLLAGAPSLSTGSGTSCTQGALGGHLNGPPALPPSCKGRSPCPVTGSQSRAIQLPRCAVGTEQTARREPGKGRVRLQRSTHPCWLVPYSLTAPAGTRFPSQHKTLFKKIKTKPLPA